MPEDTRLTRLLEYTKFHIGIYLSAAAGMVGLLATKAENGVAWTFVGKLFPEPWALAVAAVLMAIAGMAGGIIASCCTQYQKFEELWDVRQGPHKLKLLKGRDWALLEHGSFWLSFGFIAYSMLASSDVRKWLGAG